MNNPLLGILILVVFLIFFIKLTIVIANNAADYSDEIHNQWINELKEKGITKLKMVIYSRN